MPWDRDTAVLPASPRLMTAQEYYAMPVGPPYSQLIEGELFMSPSPKFFHQEIIGNLYYSLRSFLRRKPLGKIVLSPSDVELDEHNVYQPDLYYVRRDRCHLIDEQGMKGAPDFVVEVISRSTAKLDRERKLPNFARAGVHEFWAIVPTTNEVEVWKLADSVEEPAFRLSVGDTLSTDILPDWEMPVAEIFAR